MPPVRPTAGEPRHFGPSDLLWTGTIIVSVTIATDGTIEDAQARIDEGVPASFYRRGRALELIEAPLPTARQRAEETAKQDAIQSVSTARYPSRAIECRGEFKVTYKMQSDE